jgi:hypothetical protein
MLTERGVGGRLFREVVEKHYPWDQELDVPERRFGVDAAKEMYDLFRNPLAHALGVIHPEGNSEGRLLAIEKAPMQESELYELEMTDSGPERWLHPALLSSGLALRLSVSSLYWGVRQLVERVVRTPDACAFTFPTRTPEC